MFRKAVALAILIAVICVFHQSPVAQSMMKLTDQRYLELAIDMIRKGVQQEDTTKILMVMAPRLLYRRQSAGGKNQPRRADSGGIRQLLGAGAVADQPRLCQGRQPASQLQLLGL